MLDVKPWGRQHLTWAVIFGTWWNDDPLMATWGEGTDIGDGLWRLYTSITSDQEKYPGGVSTCNGVRDFVPKASHLPRWSHYDKLQHLHFMTDLARRDPDTSKDKLHRVEDTKQKALKWMKFAYFVATKKIPADSHLSAEDQSELGLPSIAVNHCVDPANVKVRTLFARAGIKHTGGTASDALRLRDRITPDVALGSMLHVIQDAFSPAHTCRVVVDDGKQKLAALKDVFNYNEQMKLDKAKQHTELDAYPGWLKRLAKHGVHTYANDPVAVGKWLIGAVDSELDWDKEVGPYLERTVFASVSIDSSAYEAPCIRLNEIDDGRR